MALADELFSALATIVGGKRVSMRQPDLRVYARDMWPRLLLAVRADGTPDVPRPHAVVWPTSTREVVELRFVTDSQEDFAGKLGGIGERVEVLPDRVLLYVTDGDAAVAEVHARGLTPASVLVRRSSLEDVFLHLTGRTLVD